jgi:hypothetical protein
VVDAARLTAAAAAAVAVLSFCASQHAKQKAAEARRAAAEAQKRKQEEARAAAAELQRRRQEVRTMLVNDMIWCCSGL